MKKETYVYPSTGARMKEEYKIFIVAFVFIVIADSIGQIQVPLGPGTLILFPIFYSLIMGVLAGPEVLKIFNRKEGKAASIAMDAETALQKTDELYDAFHGKGNLRVYYSLRSLISCSRDLILGASERARRRHTMLQAHMNEYPGEINYHMERFQKRPYEYLEELGVLDEHFLGAHSLLLSEGELELLAGRQVKVCHCPFSNCGKAAPRTPELLAKGVTVGLGTDGAAHGGLSLFNEMKIFRSVMNLTRGVALAEPAVMPAKTILSMAFRGGQACLGGEGPDGRILPGARADLIGIDKNRIYLTVYGQIANTILESVNAGDVRDSICGGRILMKDYEILTLDEEKIRREACAYRNQGRTTVS